MKYKQWQQQNYDAHIASLSDRRREDDEKALQRIFNRASESPELAKALKWAQDHGIKFIVDHTAKGVGGYYWAGTGTVAISKMLTAVISRAANVLTHEIAHAMQDYYGLLNNHTNNFSEYFIKMALVEADAYARGKLAQEQATWTMRRKLYDTDRENAVKKAHDPASGFRSDSVVADYIPEDLKVNKLADPKEQEKFLWAKFLEWYDTERPIFYGDLALQRHGAALGIDGMAEPDFKVEMKGITGLKNHGIDITHMDDIIKLGRRFGGGNYIAAASCTDIMQKTLLSPTMAQKFFDAAKKTAGERYADKIAEKSTVELVLKTQMKKGALYL